MLWKNAMGKAMQRVAVGMGKMAVLIWVVDGGLPGKVPLRKDVEDMRNYPRGCLGKFFQGRGTSCK